MFVFDDESEDRESPFTLVGVVEVDFDDDDGFDDPCSGLRETGEDSWLEAAYEERTELPYDNEGGW